MGFNQEATWRNSKVAWQLLLAKGRKRFASVKFGHLQSTKGAWEGEPGDTGQRKGKNDPTKLKNVLLEDEEG